MEKVNIFVAYMLSKAESDALEKVADEVKEVFQPEGKDESLFHTTLLFIGRVNIDRLSFIREKLTEIANKQNPIHLSIDSLGYFYNQKKHCIKVLFAKPKDIPQEVNDLCMKLYKAIGVPLNDHAVPTIFPSSIHFTITKRLKNQLSKEDFDRRVSEIRSFSILVTINGFGLYHCKDPEHRYYREIGSYLFL
jgi:2'-5' RNA ligase